MLGVTAGGGHVPLCPPAESAPVISSSSGIFAEKVGTANEIVFKILFQNDP